MTNHSYITKAVHGLLRLATIKGEAYSEFAVLRYNPYCAHSQQKLKTVGFNDAVNNAGSEEHDTLLKRASIALVRKAHPIRGLFMPRTPENYYWGHYYG